MNTTHFDPVGCLPMNRMLFLRSDLAGSLPDEHDVVAVVHCLSMYTSPGRPYIYARVGVGDPARMYVRGRIYFLAPWPLYVRVHATCAPLLRHMRTPTTTCARLYIDQYVRTRSPPE